MLAELETSPLFDRRNDLGFLAIPVSGSSGCCPSASKSSWALWDVHFVCTCSMAGTIVIFAHQLIKPSAWNGRRVPIQVIDRELAAQPQNSS